MNRCSVPTPLPGTSIRSNTSNPLAYRLDCNPPFELPLVEAKGCSFELGDFGIVI